MDKLLAAAPFVLLVMSFLVLAYVDVSEYPKPARKSRAAGLFVVFAAALVAWDLTHWPIPLND